MLANDSATVAVEVPVYLYPNEVPDLHLTGADLEVRGAADRAHATASGSATLQDFITRLSIDIDLRSAPAGPSQLAIR
jgi:hypothetical protein